MFVPFDQLTPESKIWIYQSATEISPSNQRFIEEFLHSYCDEWKAHGQPLKASFLISHNHFIILGVDEGFNATSGCSVDDSVRAIKHIASSTGIEFFDRELIALAEHGKVVIVRLGELKKNFQNGTWDETSIVFNNLIETKEKLKSHWMVPAGQTWLRKYIPAKILGA